MDTSSFEAETLESKRRKVMEKSVVKVKIEASEGKKKSEGPPCDNWSWRKYGQKPIKGSPFPRGYYRCSTSKDCSAKKQVERCKNDASLLIITYTCAHNHPTPATPTTKNSKISKLVPIQDPTSSPKPEQQEEEPKNGVEIENENENQFNYCQSPLSTCHDIMIDQSIENAYETLGVLFDEEPLSCRIPLVDFSKMKSDEYDFYDELEELPTWSIFTSFGRRDFFDERILVHPS